MKTFRLLYKKDKGLYSYQTLIKDAVIGLGFFDGVHRGHQELIAKVLYHAAKLNKPAAVFTFDRYPKHHNANYGPGLSSGKNVFEDSIPSKFSVDVSLSTFVHNNRNWISDINNEQRGLREELLKEKKNKREFLGFIQSEEEKVRTLDKQGLDIVYIQRFDDEFSNCLADDFFYELKDKLAPAMLITGEDFCFGKDRSGNVDLLRELCEKNNIDFSTSGTVYYKGEKISSSRIREAIFLGDLELAEELMGRPYRSLGEVLHGQALGSKFGIPTANIRPTQSKVMPPYGVYLSFAKIDNRLYRAVTHLGLRPTVNSKDKSPLYETFIYDFNGDLYGQVIEISLLKHEREEIEFPSLLAMTSQIAKDLDQADASHTRLERFEHTYDYHGLSAYRLQSNRFSVGKLDLVFYIPVNKIKYSALLFLSEFLTECTLGLPAEAELSAFLEDKYAADFVSDVDLRSDLASFTLSISALKNGPDGSFPFEECMEMFLEHLLNSTIDNEEIFANLFDSLKKRLVLQLKVRGQKAGNKVRSLALKEVFPNETVSLSAEELIEDCESLCMDDVIQTYHALLTEAQRVIVISGAIEEKESLMIREFLDKWSRQESDFKAVPCKNPAIKIAEAKGLIRDTHDGDLSHACLIYDGISGYNSISQFKYLLLSEILAGDTSALLFKSLRSDKSYVYSIECDLDSYLGILMISFACDSQNMNEAIDIVKDGISLIKDNLNEDVLSLAKNYLVNSIKNQSDSLSYLVSSYLEDRLMGQHLSLDTVINIIDEIKIEEIVDLALDLDLKLVYILDPKKESVENK